MKNIIFLAPPVAGKGTFSNYLVQNFGYRQISTGNILREKATNDVKLAEYLKTGNLVDDETIIEIVSEKLQNHPKNIPFILDGVPRTLHQAKKLDIIMHGLNISNVVVVYIDVEKEILIDRVVGRMICPKCHRTYNINQNEFKPKVENVCDVCSINLEKRTDDTLESFMIRYNTFLERTYPIISYYREKGCLRVLENNQVDQTKSFEQLRSVMDEH